MADPSEAVANFVAITGADEAAALQMLEVGAARGLKIAVSCIPCCFSLLYRCTMPRAVVWLRSERALPCRPCPDCAQTERATCPASVPSAAKHSSR